MFDNLLQANYVFNQGCGAGAGAGAGAAGVGTFWSEPEPEPEPPKRFARSRSRQNGAAPAPKRDTIVARKKNSKIKRNSRTKSLPKFVINN